MVINHNWREDISAELLPSRDFVINYSVATTSIAPFIHRLCKAVIDTSIRLFKAQSQVLMSKFTAVLIYIRVASLMYTWDVLEPSCNIAQQLLVIKKANLTHILKYNFKALFSFSVGINCTVLTTSKAIRIQIALFAINTFPENVTWSKCYILCNTFVKNLKIFNKIHGSIWTWC